ncbi:rab3 GTPase-activating protein catalytic subunit [Olea europaea var. sylvestris]|uniref:rab3 GTPase-activating protein catalytic subunit n=1 Tax=Olea europaea var. sylvestris TaxID=158386 RepID=UPI000C1D429F|nr:rab3 GTPase-activating protein catalytic subunit [Olea europaea var. sylvestris]
MASTSNSKSIAEDDEGEEEEIARFDDFTLASSWERFISDIEVVCRQWLDDGPQNLLVKSAVPMDLSNGLYKVKSEFKYAMKSYCMEYYFQATNDGKLADWNQALHDLQLSFGVKEFVVIAPQSASGVVLDSPEASKLLSAVAIALSNCTSLWPAFVPVHDPSRKAYIGIQNMGTVFTRRFEADRIGSQVPIKLMHLEGLYELFVSKFTYTKVDFSMQQFKIHFKMRLTYRTPTYDDEDEVHEADAGVTESGGNAEGEARNKTQWDDDCPWSEWYTTDDPVKGFELLAIWSEITAESSLEMAELENASPFEAEKWFLHPCLSENFSDISDGKTIGFASQLCLLVKALEMSLEAQFMEDFVSAVENSGSDNFKSSAVIPPPTVLDRVLKDLFHQVAEAQPYLSVGEHKGSRAIKGAPLYSLFAQFCLHALWFGNCNIHAIAVLWVEFVREVRWCWEESQPLPRMPANGIIDLSTCLINQKLHMLAICIDRQRQQGPKLSDTSRHDSTPDDSKIQKDLQDQRFFSPREASEDFDGDCESSQSTSNGLLSPMAEEASYNSKNHEIATYAISKSSEHERRGSAGALPNMMLLHSREIMHAPITQDPPLMTEDMHEERLRAAEACADSFNFSAQLEKEILLSDMSAFKAANPEAVFEDFIRWHSPKDWEDDHSETGASQTSTAKGSKNEWPPRGRLSKRMSEYGSSWRKIWNEAPALEVSKQKPLLDPNREGEKVLHYLETLRPHQLLEQMVCTAFRAAADTLNQTSFGDLNQMTTKIGQLYLTMSSTLKYVQSHSRSGDSDIIEDVRRLCVIFGHVEKLLTIAASLHRKFLRAPLLAEAIFRDYHDYYQKNMGNGTVQGDSKKEFKKKHEIRARERDMVATMFTPPQTELKAEKAKMPVCKCRFSR